MGYLEDFYNHKILIDISNASKDDLIDLAGIINKKYVNGAEIYNDTPYTAYGYLHCRPERRGLTRSMSNVDGDGITRPYVNYKEILNTYSFNVDSEDIEALLK